MLEVDQVLVIEIDPNIGVAPPCSLNLLGRNLVLGF